MRKIILKTIIFIGLLILLPNIVFAEILADPNEPVSDDFNSCSLSNIWEFVNPVGDGTYNINGTNLLITVPQGKSHDIWKSGNNATRLMQSIDNINFEIETKFESSVTKKNQLQGIIIEQDTNNFMRVDFYSNGTTTLFFVAAFINNTNITIYNSPVNDKYIKINRTSNNWKIYTSLDGNTWTSRADFNHAITTNKVGVFSGNAATNPAHTAIVDYFFNNNERINPEDNKSIILNTYINGL